MATDGRHDPGQHAIVIGASMAGLSVAKALTTAFERVTVVDRDALPDGAGARGGVPQGRHLHVLLAAGAEALDNLFPGLLDELVRDGAGHGDVGLRGRSVVNGHRLARAPLGRPDVLASRPFVEHHVRRRIAAEPSVRVMQGADVLGLVATPDRRCVTGVALAGAAGPTTLTADLVVDCSGRRSAMPQWLADLGYARPRVDELRVDLRYATRRYRLPADVLGGDLFALVTPTPAAPRGGAMSVIEGGEWIVTLLGMAGDRPPTDAAGFAGFAAELAATDIVDAITDGAALDDPTGFRYVANRRHRYERLRDFPAGLLVAGDAVCSFNPIYGQGMTVAAQEAVALQRALQEGPVPAARTWFRTVARVVDEPWAMAVGGDLGIDAVEGHRPAAVRLVNWYLERYYRAARHDAVLSALFGQVSSLLAPSRRLLAPAVVARVLRGNLVRRSPRAGRSVQAPVVTGPPATRHSGRPSSSRSARRPPRRSRRTASSA